MKELKKDSYDLSKFKELKQKDGNLINMIELFTGHAKVKKQDCNWESEINHDGDRSFLNGFHLNWEGNIVQIEAYEVFGFEKDSKTFT